MPYDLSPASEADKHWLDQLRRTVYWDLFFATWGAWDESKHERHARDCWEKGSIKIIEVHGIRVGMIQVFDRADSIEISEIQISPSHQSKGLGAEVFQDLMSRARDQRKKLTLSVALKNDRAYRFYKRIGFRHVSTGEFHNHMAWEPIAFS